MLTHDQIMNKKLVAFDGLCVESLGGSEIGKVVFTVNSIAPEYTNLLCAAPFMYQAIESQIQLLERTIQELEKTGNEIAVPFFLELQGMLHVTKRIAVEGLQNVIKDLPTGNN